MPRAEPEAPPARAALTSREVLRIAVPITLSNATVPLIGWVDTAVIGQLGVPALMGAVGIGALIFNMLYWSFSFLRMGTTGLTAQALGAGNRREIVGHLLRALAVAAAGGVLVLVLQVPIRWLSLRLTGGSPEVIAAATTYYDLRIWAAPAGLVNFALLGWFIGLHRAGTAFALQLLLNLMNIALAVLLVMGAGLGVRGVGLAALVAEVTAALAGLVVAARIVRGMGAGAPLGDAVDWSKLKRSLASNADLTVRSFAGYAALLVFTHQGAAAGDVTLAANALLMSFISVTVYLLDGFAFAAEALVGRAIGAGERSHFWDAVRLTTVWAGCLAVGVSLAIWLGGPAVIRLSTDSGEVELAARAFLVWAALSPIAGVWAFQLDGIFTGATRTRDMRNMMVASVALFLAAWALLEPAFGNHGLWAALTLLYVFRALTLLACLPALVRGAFG